MSEKLELKPGNIVKLTAVRSNDLGVFLDARTGRTGDDILLHKAQQTREVTVGEEVEVYLYSDPKGRLTASMNLPQMKEGQVAYVMVINNSKDGAFVDIGAERGIFLPFTEMRGRPRKGDKIWVKLYRDKSGRPAVTMKVEDDLRKAAKPAENVKPGDLVTGSVYNETEQGVFIFTKERNIALLHQLEIINPPKIGEELTVRVTYVREDGRLNVTQRPLKQEAIDDDAEVIMAMLKARSGQIPYSDASAPEIIKEKFKMSKSAFKRAVGRLLKAGLVRQEDGWLYLIEDIPDGHK